MPCTVALALMASADEPGDWLAGAVRVKTEDPPAVIAGGWKLAVTPLGSPEMVSAANCEKPFALASDTLMVVVSPGRSVTWLGTAVSVNVEAATIVSGVDEVPLWPFTVTVIGPVAAPEGTAKERLVALAPVTGATIILAPAVYSVTTGVAPFAVKFVPVTLTTVPMEADVGAKLVMVGPADVTVWVSAEDVQALSLLSPP
jgi:hypothetical protein